MNWKKANFSLKLLGQEFNKKSKLMLKKIFLANLVLLASSYCHNGIAQPQDPNTPKQTQAEHEPSLEQARAELYQAEDEKLKGLESAPASESSGDEQD